VTWFFAVLVVLALGGVALVAAGRGGSLPEVRDDRPEVRLPAGRLGATDLRRVRFPLAVRGYRMAEVDELLARLADQLEQGDGADPEGPRGSGTGGRPGGRHGPDDAD
jgi:DivIVA domain-containing protein